MKKFLLFALSALCFVACSSDSEDPIVPQPQEEEKVNVILTYTLTGEGGGSMSRAANEFTPFYEKIVSGELMYDNFSLTFTNTETGFVFETTGQWSKSHMLTLPKGKYTVKGGSTQESYNKGCLIKIDTTVEITSSGMLAIPAEYNCYLIAIKKNDASNAEFRPTGSSAYTNLTTFEGYYYLFINETKSNEGCYIYLSGPASQKVYLKNGTFKNGKYYIFENIPGSYTIPEMESGM